MRRPTIDPNRIRELASPDLIREQARQDLKLPYRMLPIHQIQPDPLQPRQTFDLEYIHELKDSIVENGLLQPITVRKKGDSYLLVAGECRHRAAKLAGLPEIPCMVREMDDRTAAVVGLVENVQRQDLNPVDMGRHLRRLHDEFKMTWEQVAQSVGKSVARVKALAGLTALPEELQHSIQQGKISADTGRELARVDDPEERKTLARRAEAGDLTQSEARALVQESLREKLRRHERVVNEALERISARRPEKPTERERPPSSDLRLAIQYADLLLSKLSQLSYQDRQDDLLKEKLRELKKQIG